MRSNKKKIFFAQMIAFSGFIACRAVFEVINVRTYGSSRRQPAFTTLSTSISSNQSVSAQTTTENSESKNSTTPEVLSLFLHC
jgi:hypothetical protein